MRKFILACAAVAMVCQAYAANPLEDSTVWFTGGTWEGKTAMINNSVNKFNSYVFGQIDGATNVNVPDYFEAPDASKKVHIVYPDGSTVDSYPVKVTGKKDSDEKVINNAFRFLISNYGTEKAGEYVCTIPAACMTIDGVPNEEAVVKFIVQDNRNFTPSDIAFEVSPSPVIAQTSITGVRLTYVWNWPDTNERRYYPETPNYAADIYFEAPDGSKISCAATNVSASTGYGAVSIVPSAAITESGEYTLVIPQDALRFREYAQGSASPVLICNKPLSYTFKVASANTYEVVDICPSISPAPGVVAKLSKIEFAAPEGFEMYLPDDILPITITLPDGSIKNLKPYTNANIEGEYAWLTFADEYTTPGKYKFSVPQGCFEYFVGQTGYINKAFTIEYEVQTTVEVEMPFTITPEDGDKVYKLYEVYLTLPEDYPVTFTTGAKAVLTKPDGSVSNVTASYSQLNHRLLVDCGYNPGRYPEDSEFGEYKVVIPAGTLMNEAGEINKEVALTYTLLPRLPEDVDFAIDPEEGDVSRLYIIELLAPDVEKLEPVDGGITRVTVRMADGTDRSEYLKATSSQKRWQINLGEPVNDPGNYALIVPENTFRVYNLDGTQAVNTQMVFTWTITTDGIASIESENGLYTVYTLAGVKVAENAPASALKNLRGFYVINGKNYFLK